MIPSKHIPIAMTLALALVSRPAPALALSVDEIKSRIKQSTSRLQDVSFTLTVIEKNRDAIEKVDPSFTQMYEFKTAKVYLKEPDKLRTEGKLGMVRFEYIVNGGLKIVRAPMLRINKKSDYTGNPGKLTDSLDFGILTPLLWKSRTIEVMEDAEAAERGEVKIRLRWAKASMSIVLWLDSTELYVKRLERRSGEDKVKVALVYSQQRRPDDVVWIPTRAEMYAPDGTRVGVSEVSDIKVNSGLPDSLFK